MSSQKPEPPDGIAQYIIDALDRQDIQTLELIDEYLTELLAFRIHERKNFSVDDIDDDDLGDDAVVEENPDGEGWFVIKKQNCGKDCKGCPHGPYLWHVTPDGKGGENWSWQRKVNEGD